MKYNILKKQIKKTLFLIKKKTIKISQIVSQPLLTAIFTIILIIILTKFILSKPRVQAKFLKYTLSSIPYIDNISDDYMEKLITTIPVWLKWARTYGHLLNSFNSPHTLFLFIWQITKEYSTGITEKNIRNEFSKVKSKDRNIQTDKNAEMDLEKIMEAPYIVADNIVGLFAENVGHTMFSDLDNVQLF